MQKNYLVIMKTQLMTGASILVLFVGILGAAGEHHAEARGMPIHNPNWAGIVANPTSQNGHAPAYDGTVKIVSPSKADSKNTLTPSKADNSTPVQNNKNVPSTQDTMKTKPMQQKINRENQLKSESAKIANDKAKANALVKANTHNSNVLVHQKSK
jgi:hypothetical protein